MLVRSACIIVPYNDDSKAPIQLSGRERSCLAFARSAMFGLEIALKEKLSSLIQPSFHSGIGLVPENVVMVTIDM